MAAAGMGGAALEKLAGLFQKSGDGWLEVDFSPWGSGPAEKRVFATLKTAILSRREIRLRLLQRARRKKPPHGPAREAGL